MTPIEIGDRVFDGLVVAEVIGEGTLMKQPVWKVKVLTGHEVGAESIMFKDSDRLRVVGKGGKKK